MLGWLKNFEVKVCLTKRWKRETKEPWIVESCWSKNERLVKYVNLLPDWLSYFTNFMVQNFDIIIHLRWTLVTDIFYTSSLGL